MSTTPTGNFSLTLYNLETLLASSATFQSYAGVDSVDAARDRIYWIGQELPKDVRRPFAWIKLTDGWDGMSEDSGGAGFWHQMPLVVLIELDADVNDSPKERHIKFFNFIGAVVAEMEALAKTEDYLYVSQLTLTDYAMNDESEGDQPYDQIMMEVRVF